MNANLTTLHPRRRYPMDERLPDGRSAMNIGIPEWQIPWDRVRGDIPTPLPPEFTPHGVPLGGPTLSPRPIAPNRQEARMDMTVPAPTLAERAMETAQPVEPSVRPRMADVPPPQPTIRPRSVPGMPNQEILADPSLRQTPDEARDLRIEEIRGHPDAGNTPWWKRMLIKGLEGLGHVNEMVAQTRDPRTGQSSMTGWQALAMAGGNAALGAALPKQFNRERNANELAQLEGERAKSIQQQDATLQMRRRAADVENTEADTARTRQQIEEESGNPVVSQKPFNGFWFNVHKDGSLTPITHPATGEQLRERDYRVGPNGQLYDNETGEVVGGVNLGKPTKPDARIKQAQSESVARAAEIQSIQARLGRRDLKPGQRLTLENQLRKAQLAKDRADKYIESATVEDDGRPLPDVVKEMLPPEYPDSSIIKEFADKIEANPDPVTRAAERRALMKKLDDIRKAWAQ